MPPLKGIDRGLDGEALRILEQTGHGRQIAIVDPSYEIPADAWKESRVYDYHGSTSADALLGILKLVPVDEPLHEHPEVVVMHPDEGDERKEATTAFEHAVDELGELRIAYVPRLDSDVSSFDEPDLGKGFYSLANDPEKKTVFFRTRDTKAYACAMFVVGHSQE